MAFSGHLPIDESVANKFGEIFHKAKNNNGCRSNQPRKEQNGQNLHGEMGDRDHKVILCVHPGFAKIFATTIEC